MKRSVLLGLLLVVTVGSQCREQPSQIETGYDWQPPVKSDSPPTDMPIEYRWRLTERRLYLSSANTWFTTCANTSFTLSMVGK